MLNHLPHGRQIWVLALATALPGVILALILLWSRQGGLWLKASVTLLLLLTVIAGSLALLARVRRPLLTLSGLLAALRERPD
jgi:hypothetical protein